VVDRRAGYAEVRVGVGAVLGEALDLLEEGVGGDREADVLRVGDDGGRDADDPSLRVEE